jgi:regulator of replication initiation timing
VDDPEENVMRARRELESGWVDARRDMMLWLLVEEENKVALTYEQLDEVLRQIGHIKQIIRTQLDTIATLKAAGHSMERAERILSNVFHVLFAHEAYRLKIEAALSASRTRKQP